MTISPIHHWKCNAKNSVYLVDEISGGGPGTGLNAYYRTIGTGGKFNSCVLGPTGLVGGTGFNGDYTFGSVSFWFRRRATNVASYLLSKGDGSYSLYITASSASPANKLQKKVNTSTIVDCGPTISDTNWHHIVIIETSSTTESIYVDGTLITDSIAWFDGGVRYFSSHSTTDNSYNVDLDNIQWYDRLLDSDEVDFLYAATSEDDIIEPPAVTGSGGFIVGGSAIIQTSSDPAIGTALPLHHWKCNAKDSSNLLIDEISGGGPGSGFECEFRSIISGGKFNSCVQGGNLYPCGLDGNYTFSSLSFWFRRTDLTKKSYLLSREDGAYAFYITPSTDGRPNELQKRINTSGTWYSEFSISDTNWHHIVITETASNSEQLYIDGVLDTNISGWFVNGIRYFSYHSTLIAGSENVELDNIQWYDRILAVAEVTALFGASSESITRPSTASLTGAGGFIVGGEAETRVNKDSVVGSGGFVVGGEAFTEAGTAANIDGEFPDMLGEIPLFYIPGCEVNGYFPDMYGEIYSGSELTGYFPDMYGDITAFHTVLGEMDGSFPDMWGEMPAVTTTMATSSGYFPDMWGDIRTLEVALAEAEAIFPDMWGDISATDCFHTLDGYFPDMVGQIDCSMAAIAYDILAYQQTTRAAGTVTIATSETALQFVPVVRT